MKIMHTTTTAKLCRVQGMKVFVSVLFMSSLLLAWQAAKAATPSVASSTDTAQTPTSSKPGATANYVSGAPIYTASKANTLDGLVKEVYPNSPLYASILNKALQAANPKLLNGKSNQSIQRGATLNIPNHTQLIVETLAPFAPPPVATASPPEANQYGSQSSDPSSRRLWVRFP